MVDTLALPTPLREAPAIAPLAPAPPESAAPNEPILRLGNIQGNIVGFNKDHQILLFLRIDDPTAFRSWLEPLIDFIATGEEVLAFNRLFKAVRRRRKSETRAVQATWFNIAFSYDALRRLTEGTELALAGERDFTDTAFREGMTARSPMLGDPTEATAEGNQHNWVVGGDRNPADVVIIVASDLDAEVAGIEERLYAPRTPDGRLIWSGAHVIFKQRGSTLPPPLTGHEHFGFLDGVSQPGLRGRISDAPGDVLTARQNPQDRGQGKPGQDLLWPGEFIFGYPEQDPAAADIAVPGPVASAGPRWADDGSFLVFRRLRQDVPAFRRFVRRAHQELDLSSDDRTGATLVGRWDSGAPIIRTPTHDRLALGRDDCANNHFEFGEASEPIHRSDRETPLDCSDEFAASPGDPEGLLCPFAAHIRKSYPRDDEQKSEPLSPYGGQPAPSRLNEVDTQTHRLLRRGIPFGPPFDLGSNPEDSGDRGLLFLSYQTSIVEQFEFVIQQWVNNPDFKEPGAGFDLILGQNPSGTSRERTFIRRVALDDGTVETRSVSTSDEWVIPTGGGYFFAPSIGALHQLSKLQSI